ncbi:hypothetical protein ACNVED_01090 [Legionella sp. D16C41]|uniref:hypothetical protein n=1 Tax=Legionella sp. D16C41 TaxID=3402688 RepID=UPI003AF55ED8
MSKNKIKLTSAENKLKEKQARNLGPNRSSSFSNLNKTEKKDSRNNNVAKLTTVKETLKVRSKSEVFIGRSQTVISKKDSEISSFNIMMQKLKGSLTISPSVKDDLKGNLKGVAHKAAKPQVKSLCLVGGAATLAATWEILMTQPSKLKDVQVVIISSPMWVEGINEQLWANQPWGQPKRYLPRAMRSIAEGLFPDYPDTEPLTFKMIKDVIVKLREVLKEAGIQVIEEEVESVNECRDGLRIKINGVDKVIIPHHDYHVVHSGRKLCDIPGIKLNHFGNAYKKSAEELAESPMAMVASGLSAFWAIRDFKDKTNVIHIIPKGDRELPMHNFDCVLRLEEAEFFASKDEDRVLIRGLCIKNNKMMTWDVRKSEIYSAKGFELSDVVQISKDKVTLVDTSPKSEDIYNYYDLKGEKYICTNDMRGTLLPPGNLASNCRAVLSAVSKIIDDHGDLILGDGQAVTSFEVWKEATLSKARKLGITIHENFYSTVFNQIKSIMSQGFPDDDQLWEVIKRLYNRGVTVNGLLEPVKQPIAVNKNGVSITQSQFETLFKKPTQLVVVKEAKKDKQEAEENNVKFEL